METPDQVINPAPSSKRRAKFTLGGIAVVLIVVALIVWGITRPGSATFFMTVTEVRDAAGTIAGDDVRVGGNVVGGTLERDGVTTSFDITDGDADLNIVTDEALPDAFWSAYENSPESVEIVAQGSYNGERFSAHQVLAKCPSKFKAKV